jgi:phospholipid-binding lipoprotein MlaA
MLKSMRRSGSLRLALAVGAIAVLLPAGASRAADQFAYEQVAAADIKDVMQATYGDVDEIGIDAPAAATSAENSFPAAERAVSTTGSDTRDLPQFAQAWTADTKDDAPLQVAQSGGNDINDPLESFNRVMLDFNEFLQALILRPMAEFYILMLPDEARDAIHNALDNLRSPVVLANDLLQGEGERAWETTQRMLINSTAGVGGLIDVAEKWGIKGHSEDLGQTFAVWGVPEGFYLVLPLFGPSNPRDAIGKFLDSYLDPLSHYADNTDREEISYTRTLLGGVDEFSRVMNDLQKLKETSVDYYAALRSVARQKREADIRNGTPKEGAPVPDLKYDFNAEFTAQ